MGSCSCVKLLGYVCITLKVMSLIANLVALGIPYWYKGDTTTTAGVLSGSTVRTTIREGLWKKCTDLESDSDTSSFCVDNDATTAITAIRWLIFVGSGILGIAVLAAGAAHMEKNTTAFVVAAITGFIAMILDGTAAGLYATVVLDDIGFELDNLFIGWGCIFISVGMTLIASIKALVLSRMVKTSKVDNKEEN